MLAYSLSVYQKHSRIKEIIVEANRANLSAVRRLLKKYRITKAKCAVLGGKRRQDSVYNGLRAVDKNADLVIIHDAARPFVPKESISLLLSKASICGAAITGVPVKPTIKEVRALKSGSSAWQVKKTLAREKLWEIQTPQAFKKSLLLKACKRFIRQNATDDAGLVEKLGVKPAVIFGTYHNLKVTTPEDVILAEAIASKMRA
jgi:2-C-methyl-D-erythritol 4-phosphate cytidylyltransferase